MTLTSRAKISDQKKFVKAGVFPELETVLRAVLKSVVKREHV